MQKQTASLASYSAYNRRVHFSVFILLHCLVGWLIVVFGILFLGNSANAQIIKDESLGNEASKLTPNVEIKGLPADLIDGGATRGINLFHSFREFNIGDSQRVYFNNPAGIENILTRVTGGKVSNILGTLGVNGSANLFLINPSGIVFGENSRLDVGGSFIGSTSDSFVFGDGWEFSATNPQAPPLLTINLTPGLQYGQNLMGNIINSGNLTVAPKGILGLAGKDVISNGNLTARGGTIEVLGNRIGILDNAKIDVSDDKTGGNVFIGRIFSGKDAIPWTKYTYIAPNVNINVDGLTNGDAGSAVVWADELAEFYGNISAKGGSVTGNGGFVEVSAGEELVFRGKVNTTALGGLGGNLLLKSNNITIGSGTNNLSGNNSNSANSILSFPQRETHDTDSTTIYESKLEEFSGNSNILLQASNNITVKNLSDNRLNFATGKGTLAFTADADGDGFGNFVMEDIFTDTIRTNGRSINISGANLSLGNIDSFSRTFNNAGNAGNGGPISLSATGDVSTKNLNSYSFSTSGNTGNGGTITITSGSDISTGRLFSYSRAYDNAGNAGAISLTAGGNISTQNLIADVDGFNSGNGGAITLSALGDISTGNLHTFIMANGGNGGNGGAIAINSGSNISVLDLFTFLAGNQGSSGTITLNAAGNISTDYIFSGSLNTSSLNPNGSLGDGGAVSLTAGGDILTGNIYSASSFIGGNSGNGGTVSLNAGGQISTKTILSGTLGGNSGIGGAISLTAGSDITTEKLDSSSFALALGDPDSPSFGSSGGNAADGGAITLISGGNIVTDDLDSPSFSANISDNGSVNNGGLITLTAKGDISTANLNSYSLSSGAGTAGNGGAIKLNGGGNISTQTIYSFSLSPGDNSGKAGNGGDIIFSAKNGDIIGVSSPTFGTFSISQVDKAGEGGKVILEAKNKVENIEILTLSSDGNSGKVEITGIGDLLVADSDILTSKRVSIELPLERGNVTFAVGEAGQSGDVEITGNGNLTFNNTKIESDTKGRDRAGNVNINIPGFIAFNNSEIISNSSSIGTAGNISISADRGITFTGSNSGLFAQASAEGKAANITVTTPNLTLANNAEISATATATATNTGSGNINLNAANIDLAGIIGVFAETQGESPAGTLTLKPDRNKPNLDLTLALGSKISASTSASGNGGDLLVSAPEAINISGQGKLAVETTGTGDAGNINISTQKLTLSDGVQISASTDSSGEAGDITLNVSENITLTGSGTELFASTLENSTGKGGSIIIDPRFMTIRDGAKIAVDSQGTGIGGDIELVAGFLTLDNGSISAKTRSNTGGNIKLNLQELLLLRNGSNISTTAGDEQFGGDGGNININSPFIVALPQENSDITANAFSGNGGIVNITTKGIFGIQSRQKLTENSDITASSQFGVDGEISIDNPDVDPSRGVEELPADVVNVTGLINQNLCTAARRGSEFVITGRGGLPASVGNVGNVNSTWEDWSITGEREISKPKPVVEKNQAPKKSELTTPIVEAKGWVVDSNGNIIFTAFPAKVNKSGTWLHPLDCQSLRQLS